MLFVWKGLVDDVAFSLILGKERTCRICSHRMDRADAQKEEIRLDNKNDAMEPWMLGKLPSSAPLANPYVPYQSENPQQYTAKKGLIRGTLFPGLDLPFMGMVNTKEKGDTPKMELMALGFALNELALFLDTHPKDQEVAELFASYSDLYRKGKATYEKRYGPLTNVDGVVDGQYRWLSGPWPWEYGDKEGN